MSLKHGYQRLTWNSDTPYISTGLCCLFWYSLHAGHWFEFCAIRKDIRIRTLWCLILLLFIKYLSKYSSVDKVDLWISKYSNNLHRFWLGILGYNIYRNCYRRHYWSPRVISWRDRHFLIQFTAICKDFQKWQGRFKLYRFYCTHNKRKFLPIFFLITELAWRNLLYVITLIAKNLYGVYVTVVTVKLCENV